MSGTPEYYDEAFSQDKYRCPPEDSPYYILWTGALSLIEEPAKILDSGCGPGQFAELCVKAGHEYLGLDYSPVAIKLGLEKGFGDFRLVDLREEREHFKGDHEVYTFIEFLEHVPNDLEVLADVPRGRTVILTVPDFPSDVHYRWFATIKQVRRRYQDLVSFDTGMICLSRNWGKPAKIFLLKGTRR